MSARRLRLSGAAAAALVLLALGGCARVGDLGRERPSIFAADRSSWVGRNAARANGVPASSYALTDDERLMRNLAYPLITPVYERTAWDRILLDFHRTGALPYDGPVFDHTAYATKLTTTPYRSAMARYGRVIEDIRNDIVRVDPFVSTARRVVDLDRKREKSLGYVSTLSGDEWTNAMRRVGENAMIIGWVQRSLAKRAASYRYAVERLVMATPSPAAADAERAVGELERRVADIGAAAAGPAGPPPGTRLRHADARR